MRLSSPAARRAARFGLGLATLLYFLGGMAGSVLHPHSVSDGVPTVARAAQDDGASIASEPGGQPTHDERSCFFCKALSTPALPVEASGTEPVATEASVVAPGPSDVRAFLSSASPQARAPPA